MDTTMTESTVRETKALFWSYDSDEDGRLDRAELQRFFRAMGETLTKQEMDEAMNQLDTNGDGRLGLDEFMDYVISQ